MNGKRLSLFLSFFAAIAVSFAAPLQYQTLIPTSLPSPQTLSWPNLQQSESTLSVNLHHVDNLSPAFNSSPHSLFKLRLQRDAARAKALSAMAASSKPRGGGDFSSSVTSGIAQGSGENAVYTPLLTNPKLDTFYYLGLNGISVGGKRVPGITASLFKLDGIGNGGVILDSGTSVTRLTRPAYVSLRDAFVAGAPNLKRDLEFSLFDTCFDLSGKTEVKVPTVVLHFEGADVSLPASNYLIPVDSDGKFCFAFAGTNTGLSIIGNIQQQSFRVVFDLAANRVGFAPRGCV
ncbi:hypothetical protein SASPL_138338 [Salvia splendens]|uniref:Peptidase A1 domain-containing protein n=1 Tax=Salvia splendens TaxID=180675 RepID=A0A8X8WV05_SALSN|nr:hypothetical protein SASPL_138338 [Salvia splendens]